METTALPRNGYYGHEKETKTSWDTHYQRRGRNREESSYVNSSSDDGFLHSDGFYPQRQQQQQQHRRSRSADARPQYQNKRINTNNKLEDSSFFSRDLHRDGFFCSSSQRAQSDVVLSQSNTDVMGFFQLPEYGGLVYDDSVLYSKSNRRQQWGDLATTPPQQQQQQSQPFSSQRVQFTERHDRAARRTTPSGTPVTDPNHRKYSLYEQERRYYDYAKDNLITFGSFDPTPTVSTGLSQEELLQRKRREEAREKRKEKRRGKANRSRILNFPSSLLKANSQDSSFLEEEEGYQEQQPFQSPSRSPSNPFQQTTTVASLSSEMANNGSGHDRILNSSKSRAKGIRGSMVRRQRNKARKLQMASCYSTNSVSEDNDLNTDNIYNRRGNDTNNSAASNDPYDSSDRVVPAGEYQPKDNYFDRFMEDPTLMALDSKHDGVFYNADNDYLSVARISDHSPYTETTPRDRVNIHRRPTAADFTPKSEYTPRDLFLSKQQDSLTKKSSPTSVMDAQFGNTGGVRWNENLTQQQYITSPQSTMQRFDSDPVTPRSFVAKPKSILRGRNSSLYASRSLDASSENISNDSITAPSSSSPDDGMTRTRESPRANRSQAIDKILSHPTSVGFADEQGRSLSPIEIDQRTESSGKFPESYINFIEAVACVVIQTKIRQTLAKNKVRRLLYEAERQRMANSSEQNMTPMVRRSYAHARKVRREARAKRPTGRENSAHDFYALAAIQIQAAFRGWWVRDCMVVDNYCATMIQKTYRGMRQRHEFSLDLHRLVLAQSICRRWLAMDAAVTRLYCIVRIQAFARGSLVRTRMKFDVFENDVYDAAATLIQTQWRSFVCEMNFLRSYEDILVVQSIARGWMARRRARSLQERKSVKRNSFRKPSKFESNARNGFTPSYSSHIAYMKKTLIPGKGSEERQSAPGKARNPGGRNSINKSEVFTNSGRFDSGKVVFAKPATITRNPKDENVGNGEAEIAPHENCMKEKTSEYRIGTGRRWKEREHETKPDKEREHPRLEIQAREMSEIEIQRKKMAMKAEARKKEEAASKALNNGVVKEKYSNQEPLNHREEKKVEESTGEKSMGPFRKDFGTSTQSLNFSTSVPSGVAVIEHVAIEAAELSEPKKQETLAPKNLCSPKEKGESLIARRKRELMMSNHKASPTENGVVSANVNDKVVDEDFSCNTTERGGKAISRDLIVETSDVPIDKKTDESRSSIDSIAILSESENVIMVKKTTETNRYQESMRSIRSESEQKRLDEMHAIFQRAGLLSRVKRTKLRAFEVEA